MALALDNLRGQILRGAAQRVCFPLTLVNITVDVLPFETKPLLRSPESSKEREESLTITQPLRKAKIDKLDVPIRVQQQVLGLEVAVRHALALVQEFQDEHNLCDVEASRALVEPLGFAKVGEYFAARAVVELGYVVSTEAANGRETGHSLACTKSRGPRRR